MTELKEDKMEKSIDFVLATQAMLNKAIDQRDEPDDDYIYYLKRAREYIGNAITIIDENE